MNINELEELAKANVGLTSWQCNIPADQILDLTAAYKEAIAAFNHMATSPKLSGSCWQEFAKLQVELLRKYEV